MTPHESALFEALNAKKLSPAQVAASFVIPPQYQELVGPDHSFLIGPRGSGKTTLLKMLQGQALMSWSHRRARFFRSRVRYSSVFLPADRLWASQVATAGASHGLGVDAFTTQLLSALVDTMLYRTAAYPEPAGIHHEARLSHRAEVALVEECADAWGLGVRVPSLLALQGALDARMTAIASLIEFGAAERSDADHEWSGLASFPAFVLGIRAFNRYARQPEHRWAILLDEMELAPERVQASLLSGLRGGEQRVILKLSFSPFDRYAARTDAVGGAAAENDFRPIYLWYGTRVGGRRFTQSLWTQMMKEAVGFSRSPISVLGSSTIDMSGAGWREQPYRESGSQLELMREMEKRDRGFAAFLLRRGVDLNRVEELTDSERAAKLRKVYPLLVFRDAVLEFTSDGAPVRRPRKKVTECYTGVDAVFAALEGNPRWIKAVFSRLLAQYKGEGLIPRGLQYDTISDAAQRFEALLRLLPSGRSGMLSPTLEVLDTIAAYFSEKAFGDFTADPPGVFVVDGEVESDVVEALITALSAGAVVHLRERKSRVVLPDLYGERFRLTYLLAVRDGKEMPVRLGKTVELSTILDWGRDKRALERSEDARLTLWNDGGA